MHSSHTKCIVSKIRMCRGIPPGGMCTVMIALVSYKRKKQEPQLALNLHDCQNSYCGGTKPNGKARKKRPGYVILSEAKNLSRAAEQESEPEILRFAQNDIPEGLFHGTRLVHPWELLRKPGCSPLSRRLQRGFRISSGGCQGLAAQHLLDMSCSTTNAARLL